MRIWVLVVMVVSVGMVGQAWGTSCDDLPAGHAFSSNYCRGVCYSCSGEVCCDYSGGLGLKITLIEYDGETYAYGQYDLESSPTNFCCDGTNDLGTSSAVEVTITTGMSSDYICLQDADVGNCYQEISGLQYWDAPANVYPGASDDEVRTCPTGAYDDYIEAGDGNDVVFTYDGTDTIDGDGNDDTINAGDGVDYVVGGSEHDTIGGGSGNDELKGENGNDIVRGDGGEDTVWGGMGEDNVFGGADDDEVVGNSGPDFVGGDGGDDCLCGGSHGTGMNADLENDTINGNADTDDCYYVWDEDEETEEYDTVINCGGGILSDDCPCAS